jgi:hypothetical protein
MLGQARDDNSNNLIEYMWNENKLYLPFNYEIKIIIRNFLHILPKNLNKENLTFFFSLYYL